MIDDCAVPVVAEDADSGHFDNLGTIEILVLRCTNTPDDDTRSTSSSALDTDPLGKHPETEASASVFEDASQGQEAPSGYTAPAVAEEDDDGVGFGGGMFDLFDGVNDRPDRPIFGGDGPSDGYWAYYPYQQGHNVYNEGQQWGSQPRYNPGHLPTGAFPQARPPQPATPEKRVHFDIGGPPNTRAAPPPAPQQWPDVSVPAPVLGPANHGVGQQGGYPIHPYPIPFDAIPPFPGRQMTPGYGVGATWGGQGYMPYPTHPGYGYGYGTALGYGCYPQGHHQGQGYGQGQGEPVHGPTVNQNDNMNRSNGLGDSAKHDNLQDSSWGDSNDAGNTSGNAGGDGGWSDNNTGNQNTSGGDGWDNANASNDATNADGNNDTWGQDDEKNDTGGDTNNNESGSQTGWGETINVTTPQQNDTSWENNDSGNTNQDWGNNDSSNQNDQNWGNTDTSNQNQNQGNNSWGLNNDNNTTNQPFRPYSPPEHPTTQEPPQNPPIPGSFPSSQTQPRALYGPHGPYYLLQPPNSTPVPPSAEEEPRYDVPQSHINATGSTHQIQPGRGYLYTHRRATPHYLDSVEEPYARFVFKYRSAAQLAAELGVRVDVEPSADAEVQALAGRPKEEIIAMLLRAKAALGGRIPEPVAGIKAVVDEEVGLKMVVVPAPARRVGAYTIPLRAGGNTGMSAWKASGGGLGIAGWRGGNIPQQQQQQQRSDTWGAVGNGDSNGNGNSNNAPQDTGANANAGGGWGALDQNQKQTQNQNQNQHQHPDGWGSAGGGSGGGGGAYGDPGARPPSEPASPKQQSDGWRDPGAADATAGAARATVW